jgi:superfamily II DNA or RNA helicase
MNKIVIESDRLYCIADKPLRNDIAKAISYQKPIRKKSKFGNQIKNVTAYYIDKRNGRFLYGLLHRVISYLDKNNISYKLVGDKRNDHPPPPLIDPKIKDITFRPDQIDLINVVKNNYNGIIKSPTGSGKTITALGIVSQWPKAKTLIIVNRTDLLYQFKERIEKHLPKYDTQIIQAQNIRLKGQIVISTIQTIHKYQDSRTAGYFDIIICDECHHVTSKTGMYGKFLLSNIAPIKLGLTATLHPKKEYLYAMEGLLGPVIGELSMNKAKELNILTKANTILLPVEFDPDIAQIRRYQDKTIDKVFHPGIYRKGIIENSSRNILIIKTVKKYIAQNKSCLIIIKNIEHGENLLNYAKILGLKSIDFVHGITEKEQRDKVKNDLESKKIMSVICSDIWKEGIDIPSLDAVILAGGGKSELQTIQSIGRGLRTFKGKDHVDIIDFLDPYRYLAEHCIRRIILYKKYGWI